MQATTSAMANPAMWQHGTQNLLLNCKTKHPEPEEPADLDGQEWDAELALKMIEAADPYETRLKSITADCKVGISERISQPSWSVRLMGDACEYKHDPVEGS